ncbi:MAG: formamidopyrimidine-DNA glycosylase [Planctomycetes bacterium]|nr:formamidopyrimidine-DNA glycosylase [Planctomycetota bacterium]
MPELPDLTVYIEALERRIVGALLERLRLESSFVLRSVGVAASELEGRRVLDVRRLGKRIVIGLEDQLFVVMHLMIAGRLRWRDKGSKGVGRIALAAFEFSSGILWLTEAGSKKRASLHLVRGARQLAEHDPGGLDVLTCGLEEFKLALQRENHTLKRALTDPRALSGIGNAYSDEILHAARLSPLKWTARLDAAELERLFEATRATLTQWSARLREQVGADFPEKVSAFRPEMAVHGRYREPCPRCGAPVQRIVHAEHEINYCAPCQTGGKLLADRALSTLLKGDWPKTIDEWERLRTR